MRVFKRGQLVRVKSVDMFAYLGRELHPDESDLGKVGRVEHVEFLDSETGCHLDYDKLTDINININVDVLYTVSFKSGTVRQLMDHEVEEFSSRDRTSPDWFLEEIPSYSTV